MAAPIVYEGVPGRFENTLFGGIKFWVSQRVPFRSTLVEKITNNGGKIVLLEKHADELIDDDAKKYAAPAPGAVSWKYIDESVKKGQLVNIDDYRIHRPINRPAQAALPARGFKVPYTKEDEQILVTWIRQCERAGERIQGNKIYITLAETYPQHTWHSWRDKWVKTMSLLPESSLPPVLPHLPPPRAPSAAAPATTENQTSATILPPSSLRSAATPAPAARPTPRTSGTTTSPKRIFFTEEDDKLLTHYVMELMEAGLKVNGNKPYISFEEQYPHHSWHSWRDRWVRHLSQRPLNALGEPELVHREPQSRRVQARVPPQPPAQVPSTEQRLPPDLPEDRRDGLDVRSRTPPARTPSIPQPPPPRAQPPPPRAQPPPPLAPPPPPPPPPPSTAVAQSAGPAATATGANRLQVLRDLSRRKKEIREAREKAAKKILRLWKCYRFRRNLRRRDFPAIAAFQARARGYLTRLFLDDADMEREHSEAAWYPADDEPAPLEHGSPVLEPAQGSASPRPPADERGAAAAAAAVDDYNEEEEEEDDDDDSAAAPAGEGSVSWTSEEFWKLFNGFSELRGIAPVPWVQIGPRTVELWDLWRHATRQPHHESRDWEVVAEDLGFDWIAEPDAPARVKAAFEAHLLGFETELRAFSPSAETQRAPRGEDEEEAADEEGADEEAGEDEGLDKGANEGNMAAGDEVEDEDGDANLSDAAFVSSPPVIGLKRPRGSSASPLLASFSKRPRYDPSSEISCTPEMQRQRGEHEMVATAAAAIRESPTWRSRVARLAGQSNGNEPARPSHAQEDDDDDEVVTPSQQLQSEVDAASPVRLATRGRGEPALPTNRGLPTVEERDDDDDAAESSDGFESVSKLKPSRPNPRDMTRPRRTLPWANTGSKQSATTATPTVNNTNNITARPTTTTALPISTPAPEPLPNAATASTHHPQPRPTPSAPPTTPTIDFNTDSFAYLVAHHAAYEPPEHGNHHPRPTEQDFRTHAFTALRAASFEQALTEHLLRRLLAGRGLPPDERGVWTAEDDARLKSIGHWVAGFAGAAGGGGGGGGGNGEWLPRRENRAAFGGDDAARGVFWTLVKKHGAVRVLERWRFLEDLKRV